MKLSMYRLKVTRRYYSALPENLKSFKSVFAEWERLERDITHIVNFAGVVQLPSRFRLGLNLGDAKGALIPTLTLPERYSFGDNFHA